jgi:hypothetical protein
LIPILSSSKLEEEESNRRAPLSHEALPKAETRLFATGDEVVKKRKEKKMGEKEEEKVARKCLLIHVQCSQTIKKSIPCHAVLP